MKKAITSSLSLFFSSLLLVTRFNGATVFRRMSWSEVQSLPAMLFACSDICTLSKNQDKEYVVEEEEEEEDDDDEVDELPESFMISANKLGQARSSVSAEAYGAWNQKKAFKAPFNPKTASQKDRLKAVLEQSFLFRALENSEVNVVVDAMKERNFKNNVTVIQQGADGDSLYVIEKGTLECFKSFDNGPPKLVKTCIAGDTFGELALLYNAPRAATVKTASDALCWELDRETFNHIVKDAAMKKREKYEAFLKSVALFEKLDAYELSQVADTLKAESFSAGDVIVKQGDPGDKFFVVEMGKCEARRARPGEAEVKVMDYKAGDYFGELALLRNEPRAASVLASSDCRVLSLDRRSFERLLGSLQDILDRASERYK